MGALVLLMDDSMGVSPPLAVPLSQPCAHEGTVTMSAPVALAPAPSRFAIWRTLETRADRLASYGALAVAFAAVLAYVVVF